MSLARIAVKARLLQERRFERGNVLCCDLCRLPNPDQMHELLLERDDVATPEQMERILTEEENLQLLHGECNRVGAKWSAHRRYLIGVQILRYGRLEAEHLNKVDPGRLVLIDLGAARLQRWVRSVGLRYPGQYLLRIHNMAADLMHEDYTTKELASARS